MWQRLIRVHLCFCSMLALAAGGCAYQKSVTAYEGPERPKAEIAVLDCDGWCVNIHNRDTGENHYVAWVDHFLFMEGVGTVDLAPGRYSIKVQYIGAASLWQQNQRTSVNVTLEGGHEYLFEGEHHCDFWDLKGSHDFWITDETTGSIIAEKRNLPGQCY